MYCLQSNPRFPHYYSINGPSIELVMLKSVFNYSQGTFCTRKVPFFLKWAQINLIFCPTLLLKVLGPQNLIGRFLKEKQTFLKIPDRVTFEHIYIIQSIFLLVLHLPYLKFFNLASKFQNFRFIKNRCQGTSLKYIDN